MTRGPRLPIDPPSQRRAGGLVVSASLLFCLAIGVLGSVYVMSCWNYANRFIEPNRSAVSGAPDGGGGTVPTLSFSEILVHTELGPAPSWYIPSHGTPNGTWAIMVHGLNAGRIEPLRAVAAVHALAIPILDITYRNDCSAPPSPDGLAHLGGTEWRDLEAAVQLAGEMGARHVILYGWSMGATLIAELLAHSAVAGLVSAVVLDSPVLSLLATMRFQADEGGIWRPVVWGAAQLIRIRTGTDPGEVDLDVHAPRTEPPVLVIQGTADLLVPVDTARRFASRASAGGWDVRYLEIPDSGHTRAWDQDPVRYDAAVSKFLRGYLR
jgi:uncharacterized protein